MRSAVGSLAFVTLALSFARLASAQPRSGESVPQVGAAASLVVGSKGQDTLGVRLVDGKLMARVCPGAPVQEDKCDAADGTTIRPPSSVSLRSASLRRVHTGQGKELVEVTAPAPEGRDWKALISAGPDASPTVTWSGFTTPSTAAIIGENRTDYSAQKDGAGEKISFVSHIGLCGKSVVSARGALNPKTFTMTALPIDDPAVDLRKSAVNVAATQLPAMAPSLTLLRSPRASRGSGGALVDGDSKTSWLVEGSDAGPNQFVAMSAPESVAVSGFDIQLTLPTGVDNPRAPKTVLIVTRDRSFNVHLPEDASLSPSTTFSVSLLEPIHTPCVGLVLGELYPAKPPAKDAPKNSKAAATVFVTDLSLRTRFEGSSADDLAKALKGGGDEARARADMLSADGSDGVRAAIRAYDDLDGPGQDLARRVIDAASCEEKLPLYVPMLASKDDDAQTRAHDRVRRCGKEASAALLAALQAAHGDSRTVFAEELALLSPDTAVPALVASLAQAKTPEERLLYRKALVKASDRQSSLRAFDAALAVDAFAGLPVDAKLDLLRAMGPRLGETKRGFQAFSDVSKEASDFRGRYLLLGPAAALAQGGNADAAASLGALVAKDPDPRIRARAAEVAQGIASLDNVLVHAASDSAVRVRDAATRSLDGKKLPVNDQVVLVGGLSKEPWTFVRRSVAQALAGMKGDAAVDASLASAMEHEEQPNVRGDILATLGSRGARSQRDAIKDRAMDSGEVPEVRVEALRALGRICDHDSLADLTKLALKGATPYLESDRKLSTAAISALGKLHPPDLAVRLAPLVTNKVPGDVQESAKAAIAETHICH